MTAYIWHFVEPTAWKWSVLLEWKHNSQFFKYQKRWIISWGIQKIGADMLDWGTGKSDAPCRNHLLYCFLEQRVWTSLLLKQIVCSFVKRVWSVVHGGPRLGLVSSASPPLPERANPRRSFSNDLIPLASSLLTAELQQTTAKEMVLSTVDWWFVLTIQLMDLGLLSR